MPKSRQNLSSLLSIVDYIFFNLFLVVHLRKKYFFGKEKQYSTQNSVFLERFYRKSGSPDSLYGKCRNDCDMILFVAIVFHFYWYTLFEIMTGDECGEPREGGGGGVLRYISDGEVRSPFWGLKFVI